jgi:hypothetical protein
MPLTISPAKKSTVVNVMGNALKKTRNNAKTLKNTLEKRVNVLTREYKGLNPFSLAVNHPWKKALANFAAANDAYAESQAALNAFVAEHPSYADGAMRRSLRKTRRRSPANRGQRRS